MAFDVTFVAFLALFAVLGLFQGVVNQIFRLGGLVAIWIYVKWFCDTTAALIAAKTGFSELPAYLTALIAGVLIIYFLLSIIGEIVTKVVASAGQAAKHANSFMGALLGLAKGALVAALLFCIVDIVPAGIFEQLPRVGKHVKQSIVLKGVRLFNPLRNLRFVVNLAAYHEILQPENEKARLELQNQKPLIELQNNNAVREVINDPEVQELIRNQKFLKLLSNEKVRKLLRDTEVRRLLNEIDPHAALEKAGASGK